MEKILRLETQGFSKLPKNLGLKQQGSIKTHKTRCTSSLRSSEKRSLTTG